MIYIFYFKEFVVRKTYRFAVLALCVIGVLLVCSCVSVSKPLDRDGVTTALADKEYKILGRVEYTGTTTNILGLFSFGGAGYKKMIEKAKEQYPGTDEVVNVMQDVNTNIVLGIYNRFGYTMTGLAIQYIE